MLTKACKQEGKNYDKWRAYGQSKTANMLFTVALAQKLGPKRGLLAFSLHPGVIMDTSLGSHIDWNVDFATLREYPEDQQAFLSLGSFLSLT